MRRELLWMALSIGVGILGLILIPRPYNSISIVVPLTVFVLKVLMPWFRRRFVVAILNEDLVYLITHMYALSTGKPPRDKLFTLGGVAGDYGEYNSLLRRVTIIAKEWGYGFARACRLVARETRNAIMRDFLLRFSEVLSVGEDPERFLNVERRSILSEYQAYYARLMDISRLLLGIYSSTSSSMLFLSITMLFFLVLFGADITMLTMSYLAVGITLGGLVYILYKVLPRDRMTHNLDIHPRIKNVYRGVLAVSLVAAAAAGAATYMFTGEAAYSFIPVGLVLGVPGVIARRAEVRLKNIDGFFPTFVRSFGLTYSTVPNQVRALRSVLRSDYGHLTQPLRRLYARLVHGVMPRIAWRYFVGETWSEMVRRGVNILFDAIDTGSDVGRTGVVLSDLSANIINVRKQREQISRSFEITVYVMHSLMITILVFVITLLKVFQQFAAGIGATEIAPEYGGFLTLIMQINLQPIEWLTMGLVAFVTVTNAVAIKVSQGGMYETVWLYLSLLMILSGAVVVGARTVAEYLLGTTLSATPQIPIGIPSF